LPLRLSVLLHLATMTSTPEAIGAVSALMAGVATIHAPRGTGRGVRGFRNGARRGGPSPRGMGVSPPSVSLTRRPLSVSKEFGDSAG
jgi:hypothetical protein